MELFFPETTRNCCKYFKQTSNKIVFTFSFLFFFFFNKMNKNKDMLILSIHLTLSLTEMRVACKTQFVKDVEMGS